jgi:hypothetical protein
MVFFTIAFIPLALLFGLLQKTEQRQASPAL